MSRWVDLDACPCNKCVMLCKCTHGEPWNPNCKDYMKWYNTIDVAPVKRGHWNIRGNYIECSECKQGKVVVDLPVPDYCEHCGAKNL